MKKAEYLANKIIAPMYVLGLIGMLCVVVLVHFTRQSDGTEKPMSDYRNISGEWTLDKEGTQPADLNKLGDYMDEETGVLSIYYRLPEMDDDRSIVYRSKDVYTKVLVLDEVIYETNVYESGFYNRSPGNLWNIVKLHPDYSEELVEIQIYMVYDTNAITLDSTLWGDKADIILAFCMDNIWGVTVSMLMIIIGIILMALDLMPAYRKARKRHGMIWLGLYSMLIGIWSIIETNMLQFFVADMRILQLIDNMIMILDSMPLLLYLNCEFHIFKSRFMRIFCYANTVYILTAVTMQLSGMNDLHGLLSGAILTLVVSCVALLIWVISNLRDMLKKHQSNQSILNYILQLAGLCSLWLSALCEMLRYSQSDHMDRAEYIRVGMLVFIVCLAISSQIETYKLLTNGMKYDIISSLAYSDGLTGLGNRTAYLEQLEEYTSGQTEISQLGIVFLDVNNLKKVNDNQGHEKGDELITVAAKIISDSFGKFGKTYRIGGDEFCVLMTGTSLQENYETGLKEFQQLIDEANKAQWYTYTVQIANGFSICNTINQDKIDETVMEADTAMYANKKMLKSLAAAVG
ncbi:MAG: GGDEF domain-containing protein [Blautia sp.]|nr:GGDEF domain-containing protein [Lachnoclostridium sp.]MCM1211042.1 GGDEF domain-containing protein [Blautia sp.]